MRFKAENPEWEHSILFHLKLRGRVGPCGNIAAALRLISCRCSFFYTGTKSWLCLLADVLSPCPFFFFGSYLGGVQRLIIVMFDTGRLQASLGGESEGSYRVLCAQTTLTRNDVEIPRMECHSARIFAHHPHFGHRWRMRRTMGSRGGVSSRPNTMQRCHAVTQCRHVALSSGGAGRAPWGPKWLSLAVDLRCHVHCVW